MRTRPPRFPLVALLALAAALACLATPSLASALEAPETLKPELETITASGAVLHGVLSPRAAGELGATYEFLYNASETGECKGGSSTTPGMALGGEAEAISEPIEGLNQQTVYAVCLVVHNQAKTEEAVGPVVSFLTGPPETPENEEAVNVTATSVTLKGTLNPHRAGEPGRYRFRYKQSASECEGGKTLPDTGEPAFIAQGHEAEVVEAALTGLLPDTTYTFCVFTRNEAFEGVVGAPVTFTTPFAAPGIAGESVVNVSSGEVTVSAEVNPGGLATSYSVEYEPGKSTPEAALPASTAPVMVRQRITALQPGTIYHYRFIARNVLGVTEGASETFATSATAASASAQSCTNATFAGFSPSLPDCRAYELVSSAGEVGEVYVPGGTIPGREQDVTTAKPFRAAANGGAVAYVADPGLVGGDGSSAKGGGNEYLAKRDTGAGTNGWDEANITPPVGPGENASLTRTYVAFSPNLSLGIVAAGEPLLASRPSPQGPAGCAVLYAADETAEPVSFGALFTETLSPKHCGNPATNGAPGEIPTEIGHDTQLMFAGETPDHTVRLFGTSAALAPPAVASVENGGNVYESRQGGALSVVNVLPNGSVEPSAVAGGPSELPGNGPDLSAVISPDGERVIWTSVAPGESIDERTVAFPAALYAREDALTPAAHTIQLDAAVGGAPGPSGGGQFWSAAAGGSKVFFTDCHKLTPDSTADEEGGCTRIAKSQELVKTGSDLYMYEFMPGGPRLTDITVDHDASDTLGADVQGVIGTSEDGSFVYVVAGGALGAQPNRRGEAPQSGECERPAQAQAREEELEGHVPAIYGCNLFELHFDGAHWEAPRFIARLAPDDNFFSESARNAPRGSGSAGSETTGDWNPTLGSRTAEVTPNGEAVVFSSTQDLTGYDVSSSGTAPETSGQGGNEIFLFKAGSGSLTCASCDPRNEPPNVRAIQVSAGTYLPVSSSPTFMHRWVNDAGTEVFFDSSQSLAAGDSNGVQDVYEWEAEGTAGCPVATSVYGGCVSLLSAGVSADWSFLADADSTGENVFVTHRGPLGGAGPNDDKTHLYDVRAGGGFAVSSLGCTGTGCQGVPPAAPVFATPASVTFSGVGNLPVKPSKAAVVPLTRKQKLARALRVCRNERVCRSRAACELRARRRYRAMGVRAGRHNVKQSGRTS